MAVRMSSTTSVVFDGFNESVNILLPPEASAAQLFNMSSYPESEAVAVSLLDQDGLNETVIIEALPAAVADDALPQDEVSVVLPENQSLSA